MESRVIRRLRVLLLVGTALAFLVLPAFAGAGGTTVNGSLGQWYVKLDKTSLKAGTVTFKIANKGKMEHEFVVIKTELAPSKLPTKGSEVDEKKAGKVAGEIEEFDAGKTESLKLDLKAGKYVAICNVAGHYKKGQRIGFTVK